MAALHDSVVSLDGVMSEMQSCFAWDSTSSKLYFGDVRTNGAVSFYSLQAKTGYDLYLQGYPRTAVVGDDHSSPAVLILDNGEILVSYSQHVGDSWTARSNGAGQIKTWNSEVEISGGSDYSYTQLIQLGDSNNTVLNFYRDDTANKRRYKKSTDRGSTWGSAQEFLNAGYPKFMRNGTLRVDFIITTSEVAAGNLYAGYMLFNSDATSVTFYKLDGTSVGTTPPYNASDFTAVSVTTDGGSTQGQLCIIGGNPVYTYVEYQDSQTDHFYKQSRWNGSAIVTETITQAGDGTADYIAASNTLYAGGCGQSPNDINVVYPSIKYGSGDFRVEKWTHTGTFGSGSWSKTSDISGNTGTLNFRPVAINCSGTDKVLWAEGTYTSYTDYLARLRLYPSPTWKKAKVASVTWTSAYAPSGVQAYYLMNEGSGAPQDKTGNGYNGTLVGSPTWHSAAADDHGAYLDTFSGTAYVQINALGAAFAPGSTPAWFAFLYKTTDAGTTGSDMGGFGNSGDNTPLFVVNHNGSDAHKVGGACRNNASDISQPTTTAVMANQGYQNDGEYHVAALVRIGSSSHQLQTDGRAANDTSTVTTPFTFNTGAIGVLIRTSPTNAFTGEIHAAAAGWGAAPDICWFAMDWIRGQFAGTFDPDVASGRQPFFYRLLQGIGG